MDGHAWVSAELRLLRGALGLSVAQTARAAGLAKSTWANWESGHRSPEGSALDFALQALGAEPLLKARLIYEADPAYSRKALRDDPAGPPVDFAQILRGMRLRARMTQSDLATAAGTTQGAVAKWESGESIPVTEKVTLALIAAGATPTELEWLIQARFEPQPSDGLQHKVLFQGSIFNPIPVPCREVPLLIAEQEAWRIAVAQGKNAMLVEAMSGLAQWYYSQLRLDEADVLSKRAIRLAVAHGDWNEAAVAVVTHMSLRERKGEDPQQIVAFAKEWMAKITEPRRLVLVGIAAMGLLTGGLKGQSSLDMGFRLLDVIGDTALEKTDPFQCAEHIRDALGAAYLWALGEPERAIEIMDPLPDALHEPLRILLRTSPPRVAAYMEMGIAIPEDEMDLLRRHRDFIHNEPINQNMVNQLHRHCLKYQQRF